MKAARSVHYDKPLPPPFKVGTKLRYKGKNRTHQIVDGEEVPIQVPGLVVTISKAKEGRQGTGKVLKDEDGSVVTDDNGEVYRDRTQNGYSVYYIEHKGKQLGGRCIDHEDINEWEIV